MTENTPENTPEVNVGGENPTPNNNPPPEHEGALDKVSHTMDHQMGAVRTIFSTQLMVLGMAIALILMLLGSIMIQASTVTDDAPDSKDIADSRAGFRNGAMVYNIGTFILIAMLFGGAMLNPDIDPQTRMGMFVAGGFVASFGTNLNVKF